MEEIGVLKFLRRYPVKSMMGEDLERAVVLSFGIEGDRVFAFVDENSPNKRFPWMTARQHHEMILYRPKFLDGTLRTVEVITPEGVKFRIEDLAFQRFLESRFGYKLSLKYSFEGIKDSRPVSILGLQTVEALGKESSIGKLSHERFRANLYADWTNLGPFYEDELVGKVIGIGKQVRLRVVKKDPRCAIPTLEPKTAEASPELFDVIIDNHQGCAGVYAKVEQAGALHVGDPIYSF